MQMKVAQSYQNFKNYINSSKEKIDYKYIWDLVTKPISKGVFYLKRVLICLY